MNGVFVSNDLDSTTVQYALSCMLSFSSLWKSLTEIDQVVIAAISVIRGNWSICKFFAIIIQSG